MNFCPNCGKELPENTSQFCPYCGNKIDTKPEQSERLSYPQQKTNTNKSSDNELIHMFFKWNGRINRQPYNIMCFVLYILNLICCGIGSDEMDSFDNVDIALGLVFFALVIVVSVSILSLTVRRLHDLNLSGWWTLICLVPLVGIIFNLVLAFKQGTNGQNYYGPDPLAGKGGFSI